MISAGIICSECDLFRPRLAALLWVATRPSNLSAASEWRAPLPFSTIAADARVEPLDDSPAVFFIRLGVFGRGPARGSSDSESSFTALFRFSGVGLEVDAATLRFDEAFMTLGAEDFRGGGDDGGSREGRVFSDEAGCGSGEVIAIRRSSNGLDVAGTNRLRRRAMVMP